MRRVLLALTILGLSATFSAPAMAADKYIFDKAHTQILFFVNHLGFSNSQGEFHDYDGYIMFDTQNPAESSVEVTIQTASIDMDDEKWDAHMKNEDFFNVKKYPTMTFKSTGIEVTGENTGTMTGDLTMLGVTKPVVLDVVHNKTGPHPFSGKTISGFSASGTLNRSDWGMTYGIPGVSDEVELRIEVEAEQADGSSPAQ